MLWLVTWKRIGQVLALRKEDFKFKSEEGRSSLCFFLFTLVFTIMKKGQVFPLTGHTSLRAENKYSNDSVS